MNELQKRFFEYLAAVQETCVKVCMIQHKCDDEKTKRMLYDITVGGFTALMEMIDGYSAFSGNKHDIVNIVTGEHLKENPFIELHDQAAGFLKYE